MKLGRGELRVRTFEGEKKIKITFSRSAYVVWFVCPFLAQASMRPRICMWTNYFSVSAEHLAKTLLTLVKIMFDVYIVIVCSLAPPPLQ